MSLKTKVTQELSQGPKSWKVLKNHLGNPKKVARVLDELEKKKKVIKSKKDRYGAFMIKTVFRQVISTVSYGVQNN